MQQLIRIPITTLLPVLPLQTSRNLLSRRFSLEIRPMQIPIKLTIRRLPRIPQSPIIRTQVLVPLKSEPRGPIGVRAVSPRRDAPAGIHKVEWLRDVFCAEHLPQGHHNLGFRRGVVLVVDDVGFVGDDSDEEDAAAGEEVCVIEILPDGVVPALTVGVEEELRGVVPENFVGRELEEDFGVDAHLESLDGGFLPVGEGRREGDVVGLEDADGKGGDCVISFYAAGVGVVDCDAGVGPGDVGDDGGEEETGVIWSEEFRGFTVEESVVTALVEDKVIRFRETVVRRVLKG